MIDFNRYFKYSRKNVLNFFQKVFKLSKFKSQYIRNYQIVMIFKILSTFGDFRRDFMYLRQYRPQALFEKRLSSLVERKDVSFILTIFPKNFWNK